MKYISTVLAAALLAVSALGNAQSFVNITPKPNSMTVQNGTYNLPHNFSINIKELPDSNRIEVERFAQNYMQSTGAKITLTTDDAPAAIVVNRGNQVTNPEAYQLSITAKGIHLGARTGAGLFYALRTLENLLPAQVRAGVKYNLTSNISLPQLTINDEPRFPYRGFMLDVSRHFFKVNEVKKLIDLMADYKMNRFHWHLSDDQGFRVEIKKYPKLNTIGATADNCYANSLEDGPYWTNQQYGPFYYTQDEIRDVVAYAKARHIDIVPEIDMPGHFTAAMVAYPEFSCRPEAERSVWISGGISNDVLNVANPKAIQFAKDILSELMELFPYTHVHIGGDECPTAWWESNPECRDMYNQLGLTHYRELQSHFIKEMADFMALKGRKTSVWNESITVDGADVNLIQDAGATVYCWVGAFGAARKAAELGLKNIVTPWGPYYINRKQSNDPIKPTGPQSDGTDATLWATYHVKPIPDNVPQNLHKYYTGVQGTFWTEHVADTSYLEYLALPRLFAIAEAGWTQENNKNYDNFVKRIATDTTYLNLRSFNYYRKVLENANTTAEKVYPHTSTPTQRYYYQLKTNAGDNHRSGRCMEVLAANSPLISQWANKGAKEGVLWTAPQAEPAADNYNYQLWCLEESKSQPGHYALVCKAFEEGSLNPNPSTTNLNGRWSYDKHQKHYDFILGDRTYGQSNNDYYYSIRSLKVNGRYLNASLPGQGMAVNVYGNPDDGRGGQWIFMLKSQPNEDAQLKADLAEAHTLLTYAQTYEGEKELGKFGAAEKANLQDAVSQVESNKDAQPAEMERYVANLKQALQAVYASFGHLTNKELYHVSNSVAPFTSYYMADTNPDKVLGYAEAPDTASTVWSVAETRNLQGLSQEVVLRNKKTGQTIGGTEADVVKYIGKPVVLKPRYLKAWVKVVFDLPTQDFKLMLDDKEFYPISTTSSIRPGTICAGSWMANHWVQPVRPQGNAWLFVKYTPELVTGIHTIGNDNEEKGKTYDLLGREVKQAAQQGVYIRNGKKYIK